MKLYGKPAVSLTQENNRALRNSASAAIAVRELYIFLTSVSAICHGFVPATAICSIQRGTTGYPKQGRGHIFERSQSFSLVEAQLLIQLIT